MINLAPTPRPRQLGESELTYYVDSCFLSNASTDICKGVLQSAYKRSDSAGAKGEVQHVALSSFSPQCTWYAAERTKGVETDATTRRFTILLLVTGRINLQSKPRVELRDPKYTTCRWCYALRTP
jgi:hypothetical protein